MDVQTRKMVISPQWCGVGSQLQYVDKNFIQFDERSNLGTVRESWESLQSYFKYLREKRTNETNEPDVFQLLEENIDRLLRKEQLIWAVDRFGYEKTKQLANRPIFPNRERFFVKEDGSLIETPVYGGKENKKEVLYLGGITDGTYGNYGAYCNQIWGATFSIEEFQVYQAGKELNLEETVAILKKDNRPYKVIEKAIN